MLGELPPRFGTATVELVAINAAMAGVEPDAFPLVLAALSAILVPEWNAFALTTTTSSVFPMLIVNGPSRERLRIDFRAGCLGGAAGRGSMTIGRAVSLCLRNIGGQRAGETSRTVFGQPARFGLCFGEWEERSPWPSLAQRRGFTAEQEVVTVHGGKGTYPLADVNNDDPRDLAYTIAKSLAFPMNNWFLELTGDSGQLVLLVNPMWAARLGEAFPTSSRSRSTCGSTPGSRSTFSARTTSRCCSTRDASTSRAGCGSPAGRTSSCRSCAAASAGCTASRSPASCRARCRASLPAALGDRRRVAQQRRDGADRRDDRRAAAGRGDSRR